MLGYKFQATETGDLAYRGTFTRSQLAELGNPRIDSLLDQSNIQVWMRPGRHAVFLPIEKPHGVQSSFNACPIVLYTSSVIRTSAKSR